MIADSSNTILQIVIMIIIGIVGLSAGVLGIRCVLRSTIVTGVVRHYCLCIVFFASIINCAHLFWGVPRAIWPTSLNVPIIDNIFGFAAFISDSFVYISKILLAVNRFFAIAFGGNFFIYIEKAYLVQYLILFGYPMLVSWPMFFSGYRVTWANWNNYYSMENGLFSELYLQATQVYAGYVVIGVCTVLDSLTYSLIRQRRRKYHTTRMSVEQLRLRKDHILITQMLCNNLTVILEIGAVTVILALAQPSNMLLFMCWTVSWMIASGVEGLLFVIFFREHHPCRTKSPVLFLSTA